MVRRETAVTVETALKTFLVYKGTKGEKTVHNYKQSISFFLNGKGIGSNFRVSDLSKELVLSWANDMLGRGLKLSSVNHYLTDVRVFLYWCMEEGYLNQYTIQLIKGQTPAPKLYSDEEVETLVKKPSKSELFSQYRSWVVICFILATGARASTIVNIKISDVNFKSKEITYRHLKNKGTAIVPLSKSLEKVLREYLSTWQRENEDGWLFCDAAENKCTVSSLYQAMENYCKRRGVEHKGLHALRHNFARGYVQNGGSAFKLQRILTHSTLEMTKRYVNLYSEDLKRDYEVFSPLDNMTASRQSTVQRK